jgi:hypothetical protein
VNSQVVSLSDRLAELEAAADRLDAEERGAGWLNRALAESVRKALDNRAPEPTEAQRIEALLTSGLSGLSLHSELWSRFGAASRADVFAGVAAAVTALLAEVALARLDFQLCIEGRPKATTREAA